MSGLGSAIKKGLRLAWRHRWTFGVPVATLLLPAALYVVRLPDVYKAATQVSVLPRSSAGGGGIPNTREQRTEQLMATARDRVLAEANIEAMARILYPKASAKDPLVVARARGRVSYDVAGEGTFAVSIEDRSPALAAAAVNALLKSFLDGERKANLRMAEERRDFHEKELLEAKQRYEASRIRLEDVKTANRDSLPELKDQIGSEIARLEQAITNVEQRAVSARRLLETYDKELRSPPNFDAGINQPTVEEVSIELELKGLQGNLDKALQELAALNAKYQPGFPKVKQKEEEVGDLRRTMAEGQARLRDARARADKDRTIRRVTNSKDYLETVENNRKRVLADIDADEREIDEKRQRLGEAQARRDRMPVTADLIAPYARAFGEAGRQLESREKAAENAREQVSVYERDEIIGGTIDFQVGNWAVTPVLPSGPSRMKWLASAIGLGLAIGYGLTVLRRRFDEGMVEGTADVLDLVPTGALVVAVPMLGVAHTERRNRRLDALFGSWVAACLFATICVLAWHKGWLDAPAWFRPWIGGGA